MMKRAATIGMLCLLALLALVAHVSAQPAPAPAGALQGPMPAPFPALSPEHQKFLDDVLRFWENRSQKIERYRCTFQRWEYDPVFGPRDGTFKTYSEGVIKYSAPDKGLFKVEKILHYTPPAQPGAKPSFVARPGEIGEHWVCDGASIFEHDHQNKHLIQMELPPHMRGKAIAEGPLPFLFGAEAAKIKQRFWIRPLPVPQNIQGEYWLEAFPKTRQDAASYQKVHVIIAQADFLPKGLVIFDRNFNPKDNPARTTFAFENREVNWNATLEKLDLVRDFYEPKVPMGWKKVVEKYDAPPNAQDFSPAAAQGLDQAQRKPAPTMPRR
jgi:TIGR03009 family protein